MNRRSRPRPDRYRGPVLVTLFLILGWGAVAHASGSGWVQTLGALAAGFAVVGMLAPRLALARASVEVLDSPTDAVTGHPFELTVVATRPCRCTALRPGGPPTLLQPGEPTVLEVRPEFRGSIGSVDLKIATAAPFGMLWWAARYRSPLPRRVLIRPAAAIAARADTTAADRSGDGGRPRPSPSGDLRGVREYRTGDSPRQVHWRATAHTGSLMVRESETQPASPVHVVAELPDDPARAELAASEAMGTIEQLLRSGRAVILETVEDRRSRSAAVADALGGGRRLARAGKNPWGDLE